MHDILCAFLTNTMHLATGKICYKYVAFKNKCGGTFFFFFLTFLDRVKTELVWGLDGRGIQETIF